MKGMGTMARGHERIDQRSLAMHRAIAAKLIAQPGLLAIAHDNLARWLPGSGHSRPYLDAWREILTGPVEEIARVIVEDGERMTALRQNSPFAGVLTPKERWEIYGQFELNGQDGRGA
jgi:hypothetical protein